jgi:ketosteroid isomerase-like protein
VKRQYDPGEVARASYPAYANKDRATIEKLIATVLYFTSPLGNLIDRAAYFARCWPNCANIAGVEFIHLVLDGDHVFVAYEGQSTSGKRFRNSEILTVRDGKIVEAEVYFGWTIRHEAEVGGFINPEYF